MKKNRLFQDIRIQTILDKSPWDSTAIFIIFCHFMIVENDNLGCVPFGEFKKGF